MGKELISKKTLVFVPGLWKVPVHCQVTVAQRIFIEAKLLTITKRSKFRVEALRDLWKLRLLKSCTHYDKQLEFKEDLLRQAS